MQPRLTIDILVLQLEGLVCAICYLRFLFQMRPGGVFPVPQQIAVDVGLLARYRCRYRYICHLNFAPVTDGYRPKQSGFGFRGRLKTETACYVRTEGFMRATACYSDSRKLVIKTSILSINLIGTITVYSKFSSNELLKSYIAS